MIYSALFVLSGCATFVIQYYLGLKRKIPALPLTLALSGSLLMFMIFMKAPFVGLGLAESEIASVRYMMTGGLGTVVGVLAARYVLKIGFERLDDAALVFPLAVFLVKGGCFFAGCCFGVPGGGVFGVTYADLTPAHIFYMHEVGHATHTPLLHPVQLYEATGAFLILVAMWFMRTRWKQQGSAFFFLIVAYLPLRVLAESFRASDAVALWNGVKVVQLVSIAFWIIAVVLWRRNEVKTFFVRQVPVTNLTPLIAYFLVEVIVFVFFFNYLHFIEKSVIAAAFLFTAMLILREIPRWSTGHLHRAAVAPAVLVIVIVCTAQVSPDSVAYKSLRLGVSTGHYVNTYSDGNGCDAITRDYQQEYTMVGAGFSSFVKRGRRSSEWGVTAFGGSQTETGLDLTNQEVKHFNVFGGHVYGKLDGRWFGIGTGLNFGNLRYAENKITDQLGKIGYISTPVLPSVYVRVGPRRVLFGQYSFADGFPASTPGYLHQFSLGSGFGIKNGFAVSVGGLAHGATFFNVTVPARAFEFDLNYASGPTPVEPARQFRFSIKYHLPATVKKPKPQRTKLPSFE